MAAGPPPTHLPTASIRYLHLHLSVERVHIAAKIETATLDTSGDSLVSRPLKAPQLSRPLPFSPSRNFRGKPLPSTSASVHGPPVPCRCHGCREALG
eukprot:scaffold128_cov118-Isochrysis_galbana.AAC.7